MESVEKKTLIEKALAKIATDGDVVAMTWLADQIQASYEAKLNKALTHNEINDKILFQIMNY
jgi:cobalamin biosynthesis protein CbiD